jgi:hypothetical protein
VAKNDMMTATKQTQLKSHPVKISPSKKVLQNFCSFKKKDRTNYQHKYFLKLQIELKKTELDSEAAKDYGYYNPFYLTPCESIYE